VIITRFASGLPALLSRYTSHWFLDLLGHEIQGPRTRLPELLTVLVREAHEKNRERTTPRTNCWVSVVDSHGVWPQRGGTAVEVL
jgi:hypothetical protein